MRITTYLLKKRIAAFLLDIYITLLCWLLAVWITSTLAAHALSAPVLLAIILIQSTLYVYCGLYRSVWRYASVPDLLRIIQAVVFGVICTIALMHLINIAISIKIYFCYCLSLIFFLASIRLMPRCLHHYQMFFKNGKRVLVVGAGNAGEGLIRDLRRSALTYEYQPLAFVDDNPLKQGCEVHGIRVLGSCKDIPKIVVQYKIELILIAIPSANSGRMRRIVKYCEKANVPFRTLPNLKDIADGTVKVSSIREVLLEDLLGREQIYHDSTLVKAAIHNQTILVTGGGGSIGTELCRQIVEFNPKQLIIVDSHEYNLYAIDLELSKKCPYITLRAHLANVTDYVEMQKLFEIYKPDIIFHVAAYKHVPLLENHVRVAMYNNIIGTKTIAELANAFYCKTFVLISTDKAVNPTNVMGASKRASEVFCQNFNIRSKTRFITVRFGNVLDSAGSVIPLFRKQLLNGGPLTVTHPDITRYFMTIPEAAQLILQAVTIENQGEIFVLDMGKPIKIRYLAEQMIKLSGKAVDQDIKIEYTGLRPGEKLYEELFHEHENICRTTHPKIMQAKIRHYDWQKLQRIMQQIIHAYHDNDETQLMQLLYELVPEYLANISKKMAEESSLL